MLHILDMKGIAVSTGAACNSKSPEISHVLIAIGLEEIRAKETLRFSIGKENTIEEIDYILNALAPVIKTR